MTHLDEAALQQQFTDLAKTVTSMGWKVGAIPEHIVGLRGPLIELMAYTRPIASIRTILVLIWLTQLATLAWLVWRG